MEVFYRRFTRSVVPAALISTSIQAHIVFWVSLALFLFLPVSDLLQIFLKDILTEAMICSGRHVQLRGSAIARFRGKPVRLAPAHLLTATTLRPSLLGPLLATTRERVAAACEHPDAFHLSKPPARRSQPAQEDRDAGTVDGADSSSSVAKAKDDDAARAATAEGGETMHDSNAADTKEMKN